MDLIALEAELHKRLQLPQLAWGRRQNDHWDHLTNFIYHTPCWDDLQPQIARCCPPEIDGGQFFAYAVNRWFNFWSARGVEEIFCRLDGVEAAKNPHDRLVDFSIHGIRFDHKTSVFPAAYPQPLYYARYFPADLIRWFYDRQSDQQRQHFANRLFLVLVDTQSAEHWKLRAELTWLQGIIETYTRYFSAQKLVQLTFENGQTALSDIIWAIK